MRMDVKTNPEVDGQCQYGLEGEGTVGGGDTKPGCVEATCQEHRPLRTSGKMCVGRSVIEQGNWRQHITNYMN